MYGMPELQEGMQNVSIASYAITAEGMPELQEAMHNVSIVASSDKTAAEGGSLPVNVPVKERSMHRVLPKWIIECALQPPTKYCLSPEEELLEQIEEFKMLLEEDGPEKYLDMGELHFDVGFDSETATSALEKLLGADYAQVVLNTTGLRNQALISIINHSLQMRQMFCIQDC